MDVLWGRRDQHLGLYCRYVGNRIIELFLDFGYKLSKVDPACL